MTTLYYRYIKRQLSTGMTTRNMPWDQVEMWVGYISEEHLDHRYQEGHM